MKVRTRSNELAITRPLSVRKGAEMASPATTHGHQKSRANMAAVKIHPTALVDPGAQIGADVEIGPFSDRATSGHRRQYDRAITCGD